MQFDFLFVLAFKMIDCWLVTMPDFQTVSLAVWLHLESLFSSELIRQKRMIKTNAKMKLQRCLLTMSRGANFNYNLLNPADIPEPNPALLN